MSDLTRDERQRNRKLNEAALYDIGFHNSEQICAEMDALLEEYSDVEVPGSLDDWFEAFKSQQATHPPSKNKWLKLNHYSKRVAVIFIVVLISAGTITLGVEANRVKFFNYVIDVQEKFSNIILQKDVEKYAFNEEMIPSEWESYYFPEYMPGGYELLKASGPNMNKVMEFSDGSETIVLIQSEADMSMHMDTEEAKVMEIEIEGSKVIMVNKNEYITVYWYKKDTYFVLSGHIETDNLVEIASSLQVYQ